MRSEVSDVAQRINPVQLQKFLGDLDYPATKRDLIQRAQQKGADENTLNVLQEIPDRQYDGPNAVSREVSHVQ
jgi:hypothetical protein